MTPIGPLIDHENPHLRMVAVHRAWSLMYLRRLLPAAAAVQLRAARERLDEARDYRAHTHIRAAVERIFFDQGEIQ